MAEGSASTGQRTLLTNAVVNWIGFAAQVLVTLLLAPLLLKGLGDRRYGVWSQVESVLAYLMLFDLGVAASVVRNVARFEATKDRDSLNRVFSTSVCIFLVAGACVLALALAAALGAESVLRIPDDLLNEGRWLLILLGLNLAIGLPLNVYPCVLDGLGRFPAKAFIRTVSLLLRVPLFLIALYTDTGLVGLAVAITGLNLLENLALAVAAKRYLPDLRFSFALVDRQTFRTIKGYSLDAFLAMIAGRISFQTDAIVIGAFLAPEYIAYFALAGKLVEYAKSSLRTATTVLTPAVSTFEARGDMQAIRRILLNSTRYVVWIILPVQLGLLILGKPFLAIWLRNDRYAVLSYPTLVILALPLTLIIAQSVSSRILYGIGRLRAFSRLVMAEALVNLGLSILLVRPLGIEGVAWGTTIPNLVCCVALAVYICRVLEVPFLAYLCRSFVLPLLTAGVLAVGWLLAARWINLYNWPALLLTGTAGLAGYLVLAGLVEFGPRAVLRRVRSLLPSWQGATLPAGSEAR